MLKKAVVHVALGIALVCGLTLMSGCSGAQKGAAGGGLVGALGGAVVGNNIATAGPMTGMAVGAGGGAAVGGIAGDAYEQVNRPDYERELENLRAELMDKDRELAMLRASGIGPDALADLESFRNELAQAVADMENLKNSMTLGHDERRELENELAMIRQERDRVHDELAMARTDRDALEAELASLRQRSDDLESQLADKTQGFNRLNNELTVLQTSLSGKDEALQSLKSELESMNVMMEETSRGLTLTIVNSFLFSPGEATLTPDGLNLIGDVARIIKDNFPNREMVIEGHTDNQPIVHSNWGSNWELGAARALNLLYELTEVHGINPGKVSATSFGEFRPVAPNETATGRNKNRRAVIVILPEDLSVQRESLVQLN